MNIVNNKPEPILYEMSRPGAVGYSMPESDVPETPLPMPISGASAGGPETGVKSGEGVTAISPYGCWFNNTTAGKVYLAILDRDRNANRS